MELSICNVTYRYPNQPRFALQNVNVSIDADEFVLVVGSSSSGKTTLLRTLNGLAPSFYGGAFQGDVTVNGRSLRSVSTRELAGYVGSVFQDPERQFVMQTVERELAFGLENKGIDPQYMERRIVEVLSFFDMSEWHRERIALLSGGQKQRLAIASAMVTQPEALVLDEPTSQLDPTAAEDVFHALERIRSEWGVSIVMAEHRLDRALPVCSRIIHMAEGKVCFDGTPQAWLATEVSAEFAPLLTKTFRIALGASPVNVREARQALERAVGNSARVDLEAQEGIQRPLNRHAFDRQRLSRWFRLPKLWRRGMPPQQSRSQMLSVERVAFHYPETQPSSQLSALRQALCDVSLRVDAGEIVTLIGPNGSGKTTLLKLINGLLRPESGAVWIEGNDVRDSPTEHLAGKVGYVPQNPNDYFLCDTVMEECLYSRKLVGLQAENDALQPLLEKFELWDDRDANPRDLSGGQRIRAAMAAVMASDPTLLLLDEPTRGLDSKWKERLGAIFKELAFAGKSIVVVTHDLEFAAEAAHRVVLLFGGQRVADGTPQEVFSSGLFYCPPIGRTFHAIDASVVTAKDASAFFAWRTTVVDVRHR